MKGEYQCRREKRVYNGKYALSSVVVCGRCGDIFRRIKWYDHGKGSVVWRCVSRVEKDGPDCPARTIHEETLHAAVVEAVNSCKHPEKLEPNWKRKSPKTPRSQKIPTPGKILK